MEQRKSTKRPRSNSNATDEAPAKKPKVAEAESVEQIIQEFKKDLAEEKGKIFDKLNNRLKKEQGERVLTLLVTK